MDTHTRHQPEQRTAPASWHTFAHPAEASTRLGMLSLVPPEMIRTICADDVPTGTVLWCDVMQARTERATGGKPVKYERADRVEACRTVSPTWRHREGG